VLHRDIILVSNLAAAFVFAAAQTARNNVAFAPLRESLGAFRDAAAAVDAEAATQGRFVAETSSAMDEMAASIEGVRAKSKKTGKLTTELSRQGEGGGQAIREKLTKQEHTTDQMAGGLTEVVDRLVALVETSQRQAEAVAGLEASFAEVRREVDRNAAAETLQAEVGRFQI